MLPCTQLADQLPHRLGAVRDHPKAAHFPILLGYRNRDRLGMDIQSQKSYPLLHGRFLSACGSGLCSATIHSLTHDQRTGTGHSMMTTAARWPLLEILLSCSARNITSLLSH